MYKSDLMRAQQDLCIEKIQENLELLIKNSQEAADEIRILKQKIKQLKSELKQKEERNEKQRADIQNQLEIIAALNQELQHNEKEIEELRRQLTVAKEWQGRTWKAKPITNAWPARKK